MKVSATQLMKQLKYVQEEINELHRLDIDNSRVLVEKANKDDGSINYIQAYAQEYDFASNRNKIKQLYEEERKIKNVLSVFNNSTLVSGFNYTINEGLIRIAELKNEINTLNTLAKRSEYSTVRYSDDVKIYKTLYSIDEAKEELRKAQKELSAIQVAVDKTNLISEIEF